MQSLPPLCTLEPEPEDMVVGITSEFMRGWVETISSLGSMAYGARNYDLVGQYVQTTMMCYVLCQIPMAV